MLRRADAGRWLQSSRGGGASAAELEAEGCAYGPDPDQVAAEAQWVYGSSGFELVADLPAGSWKLDLEAQLGPFRYTWAADHSARPDETSVIRLDIPPEAWLDTLSGTYLTFLVVKLHAISGEAKGLVILAPLAYLAWFEGPGAPPQLLDQASQQVYAPLGVLSDDLREAAHAADPQVTWILPPLLRLAEPRDPEEDK